MTHARHRWRRPPYLSAVGPGLVTGAADDDPSGIATYAQAGATFGYALLWPVVLGANIFNIASDIAAMGEAARLVTGGDRRALMVGLAVLSLGLQMFVPYHRYVGLLKWLTVSLFAYVGVVLMAGAAAAMLVL